MGGGRGEMKVQELFNIKFMYEFFKILDIVFKNNFEKFFDIIKIFC